MVETAIYSLIETKTNQIKLRKKKKISLDERFKITSAEKAAIVFSQAFKIQSLTEEFIFLLCLDSVGNIKGLFEVSHGTINQAIINIRGIFQRALLCDAASIIIAHNHPSGDSTPSREDSEVYNKLIEAGKLMEISLLDNLIIGKNEFYSFKEQSKLSLSIQ